jgi:CRISPR-associated protein Csd1
MILKALYDYYHRCGNLPQKGLELKQIAFIIVLDSNGKFLRIEDRRKDISRAQEFLVMKSVNRTSAPKANYLYDNSQYVFGYSEKNEDKNSKYFDLFKAKIKEIYESHPDSRDLKAISKFYENSRTEIIDALKKDNLWDEVKKSLNKRYSIFTFLIEGDTRIVAEKQELLSLSEEGNNSNDKNICLITGNRSKVVQITTSTSIPGSQSTAKLVSFQIKSGYDSYGKKQGDNAPIGEEAEFAYTTALNHLLRKDSRNKFIVGNRTFVFWASSNSDVGRQVEDSIFSLFGFSDSNEENPNQGVEKVRKVFQAIYSSSSKTSSNDIFYILGMAPNSARIAVTYWAEIPLKDFAERINRHFDDMSIVDTRKEQAPYIGLYSMLRTVTLGGKLGDVTPNLPEAVVKSIFQGLPYPQTLYSSCLRRIRAEQSINVTRVAIIKAYLNRLNNNEQKIKFMLDKENNNQGYLCGRLFAVLDKIQEEANNLNSIRERYMNSASATPAMVFPAILNLSFHHSEKLKEGRNIWFEKLKQEIVDKISSNGFPTHLDLQDQGRFFVGYYHQRQEFFEKKRTDNENE